MGSVLLHCVRPTEQSYAPQVARAVLIISAVALVVISAFAAMHACSALYVTAPGVIGIGALILVLCQRRYQRVTHPQSDIPYVVVRAEKNETKENVVSPVKVISSTEPSELTEGTIKKIICRTYKGNIFLENEPTFDKETVLDYQILATHFKSAFSSFLDEKNEAKTTVVTFHDGYALKNLGGMVEISIKDTYEISDDKLLKTQFLVGLAYTYFPEEVACDYYHTDNCNVCVMLTNSPNLGKDGGSKRLQGPFKPEPITSVVLMN